MIEGAIAVAFILSWVVRVDLIGAEAPWWEGAAVVGVLR
jgi:hypothetical protein